jgi:hypothetical protein
VCNVPLLDITLIFQVYEDSERSMSLFSIDHDDHTDWFATWLIGASSSLGTIGPSLLNVGHPAPTISTTLLELHLRRLRT